jgi:hypothetical protein
MREERKVAVFTCDAERCDAEVVVSLDEGLADGFHGTVTRIDSAGGRGGDWFACKEAHIRDAVVAVTERRD